jgi:hypothetical protein
VITAPENASQCYPICPGEVDIITEPAVVVAYLPITGVYCSQANPNTELAILMFSSKYKEITRSHFVRATALFRKVIVEEHLR